MKAAQPTIDSLIRQHRVGDWLLELLPAQAYSADYVAPQSAIGFAFDSQRGEHAFDSDHLQPFLAYPNSLAFVPRGCSVYSASSTGGEYLRLVPLDTSQTWGERLLSNELDAAAIQQAQTLRRGILLQADPLLLEEGALELAESLRRCLSIEATTTPMRWITPTRMSQIDELIESRLSGPLSVAEVATALGLSEGFFARAFRLATGETPHRYIIARRLARARELLRHSPWSLVEIALACGFSSQAHLTSSLRQHLGVTPAALRRG